jgi:type I restriction enzyme S subunit
MVKAGYKQTEVGLIPDDWGVTAIGEVTSKVGSGITPTGGNRVYKSEGRPFIRSQNIGWGALLLDDVAYIDDSIHSTFIATEIVNGDVFLNITGASIGRSSLADARVAGGNVNQHVCLIRADQTHIIPKFINLVLLSRLGQGQIDSFQAGGNRQGLNFGHVRSILLPLPKTTEQQAIASALSDTDELIESLEQLLTKKRQIKQGAMQELLTGKKRLPGFSGEWEVKKLGDLGKTFGGLTGKTKSDFGEGNGRFITFMNVMSNVVTDPTAFEKVRIDASENQTRVLKGDLLFNSSSETPEEVAMCSLLDTSTPDLYLNSFCFGFRLFKGDEVVGLFFAYLLRSPSGRKLMSLLAQGSTRYNISKGEFLKTYLLLPSFREQNAIAEVLSDMDAEIEALETKLTKARQVKQGMMQELLTGRIRLV